MRASKRLRFPGPPFVRAREPGRPRAWLSLLLGAFALAAFLFGGVAGFLLWFALVLLIIDRTWPISGLLLTDAQHAGARMVRERRLAGIRRRLRRRPADADQLRCLPDAIETGAQRRALGVQPIAIDAIVGTTQPDKAKAFDNCFRPPAWSQGRWQTLWIARCRGTPLAPISVYRVGGEHYVRDGHHRVSVARALGDTAIDAEVVELRPRR
jgi:membrane protein implicated in regulation of membrane protease activity